MANQQKLNNLMTLAATSHQNGHIADSHDLFDLFMTELSMSIGTDDKAVAEAISKVIAETFVDKDVALAGDDLDLNLDDDVEAVIAHDDHLTTSSFFDGDDEFNEEDADTIDFEGDHAETQAEEAALDDAAEANLRFLRGELA